MKQTLNKITWVMASLVLLFACSQGPSFNDLQGNVIHLKDYRGKWVFINYWASWCKPCYKEIPAINAFYKAHAGKDAMVFGVSYDQGGPKTILAHAHQLKIAYPIIRGDPANILGIGSIPGLPATYLFGPDGKFKRRLLGEQTQQSLEKAMHSAT